MKKKTHLSLLELLLWLREERNPKPGRPVRLVLEHWREKERESGNAVLAAALQVKVRRWVGVLSEISIGCSRCELSSPLAPWFELILSIRAGEAIVFLTVTLPCSATERVFSSVTSMALFSPRRSSSRRLCMILTRTSLSITLCFSMASMTDLTRAFREATSLSRVSLSLVASAPRLATDFSSWRPKKGNN